MKRRSIGLLALCFLLLHCSTSKVLPIKTNIVNTLEFEKSPYGLIFTKLMLEGKEVNTMIDFGDPNILQISSSLVDKLKMPVTATGAKARFISGEEFDINAGIVDQITIGKKVYEHLNFSSSLNEMESVSKQIGTTFNASIGWGYFKQYHTVMDYKNQKFELYDMPYTKQRAEASIPFSKGASHLILPITVNQKKVYATIDTGSSVSVIDKALYEELGQTSFSMKIGDKKFDQQFYAEDLSVLSDLNIDVIIGGDFLSQYRVYINPFDNLISFY